MWAKADGGFSLIEIAVVLAVSAVIGLVVWQLLPVLRGTVTEVSSQAQVLEAQQAIEGFVLRTHRLPCAASSSDGVEDCAAMSAVGTLPYKTLGLSPAATVATAMRYGVFRNANIAVTADADLAVAKNRYRPLEPVPSTAVKSGLDFCVGLLNGMAAPAGASITASNKPAAYVLVHPGANGQIEAVNAGGSFAIGSGARDANYDDYVLTSGLSELFGRLNCPERLGQANGAARAAYTAYDVARLAKFHENFRRFDVEVQKQLVSVAELTVKIATADLVIVAMNVAITFASVGDASLFAGAIGALGVALDLTLTIVRYLASGEALVAAKAALAEAEDNLAASTLFRNGADTTYTNARTNARALRIKGLVS